MLQGIPRDALRHPDRFWVPAGTSGRAAGAASSHAAVANPGAAEDKQLPASTRYRITQVRCFRTQYNYGVFKLGAHS